MAPSCTTRIVTLECEDNFCQNSCRSTIQRVPKLHKQQIFTLSVSVNEASSKLCIQWEVFILKCERVSFFSVTFCADSGCLLQSSSNDNRMTCETLCCPVSCILSSQLSHFRYNKFAQRQSNTMNTVATATAIVRHVIDNKLYEKGLKWSLYYIDIS